jgi:hypothetical protein
MKAGKPMTLFAAVILAISLSAPAFADGGGSHGSTPKAITGTISAASGTSITVGSSTYNFAGSVTVVFRDHTLTTSEIPTGVGARVFLDANGNVDRVVLSADPSLPSGQSYWGTVAGVSQNTIQVGTYTLNLAPDVTVKYHDRTLPIADVTSGLTVKVSLDAQGNVQSILIKSDPNIPKGESVRGTVSAVSSTSITIGSYTLAVSPNVEVRFHDHVLTIGDVPTNVEAQANIDSNLEVTKIVLRTDPNLPNGNTATGVIAAVYGSSLAIGSYTLTLSSSATVQYHSYRLSVGEIPVGVQAKAKLDGQTGEVTKVKLQSDPNLPSSRSFTASVASVGSATIALGNYTLPVDPSVQITYKGQTESLTSIQSGWTVKVHLSRQGTVDRIKIKSGPTQSSSSGN